MKDNQDDLESRELISELSFCVIDLETTGGNLQHDKIIEIGLVKVEKLKIVSEKSYLVNPEKEIPEFIQKLTNIKTIDVQNAPRIEEIINEIIHFIGDSIIVAHNTSFDIPFLNAILDRLGKNKLENKVLCTNVMTKHLIPEIMNSNLNYMSNLFDIEHAHAHRAIEDAKATTELLLIYLEIFIDKGIRKINQLYYPRNKFELDRLHYDRSTTLDEIYENIINHETPMLITMKGDKGIILASIPIESPKQEIAFIKEIMALCDWHIISIKLIGPIIEGIFQFNNHLLKYPPEIKNKLISYLTKRYEYKAEKENNIFKPVDLDFVITPHLIREQLVVYSFLNLNPATRFIFKFPHQKKKMFQHLISQINRYEVNQKGMKRNGLHSEIIPIVESILLKAKDKKQYLFISRKEIKEIGESLFGQMEEFTKVHSRDYDFPKLHL